MFSSSVIYNSLTPSWGVCAWGMSTPVPCDCAAPVMENNNDEFDYPDIDQDGMLFLGTPASFSDPNNFIESNYYAPGHPVDLVKFSSTVQGNLWHEMVRRLKHGITASESAPRTPSSRLSVYKFVYIIFLFINDLFTSKRFRLPVNDSVY